MCLLVHPLLDLLLLDNNSRPSGDLSAVEPPVPIPNTEVKRCSPDDSASIGCAKVGRRQYLRPD